MASCFISAFLPLRQQLTEAKWRMGHPVITTHPAAWVCVHRGTLCARHGTLPGHMSVCASSYENHSVPLGGHLRAAPRAALGVAGPLLSPQAISILFAPPGFNFLI